MKEIELNPREARVGVTQHSQERKGSSRSYPSEGQCQLEYEMGGEYEEEIPRRIFRDGSQNRRELEPRLLGPGYEKDG